MPIDAICPGCQAKLRMGDEFAGQQARCPRCDAIYLVPNASPEVRRASSPSPPEENAAAIATDSPPTNDAQLDEAAGKSVPQDVVPASTAPEPASVPELPPPDGTQWFLKTPEGPIYGPATEPVFQRWLVEGRITKDCLVCPGDNRWHLALKLFPELAAPRPLPKVVIRAETIEKLNQPHRGLLILILGIMGIVTTCPVPGIMAWIMGSRDLVEMQRGRMDSAGQNMTHAGRFLGMAFTMLYAVALVVGLFALMYVAAGM